jgi:hypothetical protein
MSRGHQVLDGRARAPHDQLLDAEDQRGTRGAERDGDRRSPSPAAIHGRAGDRCQGRDHEEVPGLRHRVRDPAKQDVRSAARSRTAVGGEGSGSRASGPAPASQPASAPVLRPQPEKPTGAAADRDRWRDVGLSLRALAGLLLLALLGLLLVGWGAGEASRSAFRPPTSNEPYADARRILSDGTQLTTPAGVEIEHSSTIAGRPRPGNGHKHESLAYQPSPLANERATGTVPRPQSARWFTVDGGMPALIITVRVRLTLSACGPVNRRW